MKLAVIPARGGSKRIPGKNIRPFGGVPIIAWSIRAAREAGCFDRILVSTDDAAIGEVAQAHGADVPFLRPPELSDDHTGTIPVIAHAVAWQNAHGGTVSEACCIYATAPFLRASDLQRGLQVLEQTGADYAFSVTSFAAPIQRALRVTPEGRVAMLQPEHFHTRSQDLEETWHDAAQFYWGRAEAWLSQEIIFGPGSAPVPLPRQRVQDIDTPDDWDRAEWMFRALAPGTEA
ncbi:pseudaminic acid cytidylyltransferase [Ancylobacter vacuolatus]|uniref:N-acylneuraminate cytidylyltransferase n=1 Tax=Ancylobacter vacuolatus TaxID=223389 RepID=A0ABU0DKQ4_9HYPH|nr:pseudaminic acid cytidylyltransferase [Ancylobacter vacuolatus]MDQ0349005.1 N-acylneuraminate cytidylyltransferase [Ancylobacter vacuolatus]